MSEIGAIELVFLLLLLFIVIFGLFALKLKTPYPIVMVVGGLLLALLPGLPAISLEPDLIFLVVLPPLLYASAWTTSWRDFRYNFVSIFLLAFVLVGVTVLGVALIAPRAFAGFDWRIGLVLGAVVAPTDAIAATSIARRLGLPSRIVDILEGESLINDATGLLALQFATAIVVSRQVPTLSAGVLTLIWLIVGGIGVGLIVVWVVDFVERQIDDGPIEIAISILIPYTAYLAANAVHASGVLAVVTCGLILSRRSAYFFSPVVRIQVESFWVSFSFLLNGLVFVLIGLQLRQILTAIRGLDLGALIRDGAIFSALLILLRLFWNYPGAYFAWFLRTRLLRQNEPRPPARAIFVVGWTGMRGVVSLAAALALPVVVADGSPFPRRNLILFFTFNVIVVTLVLQGITLPPLIRLLGLAGAAGPDCEEREARRIVTEAVLARLQEVKERDSKEVGGYYDEIAQHYRQRLVSLQETAAGKQETADLDRYTELSREMLEVERQTAVRLRDEGRINDEVLRRIERELDLTESRYTLAGE
jgi:Na+/H+ antiporter